MRGRQTLIPAMIVAVAALATAACAQVPALTYANPIAGFSMTVPSDWEMGGGVLGAVMVGLDGDMSLGFPSLQPIIWVFYAKTGPEATANNLARALGALEGQTPQVVATGAHQYELAFVSAKGLREHWICRIANGHTYVTGGLVPNQLAPAFQAELDTALASAQLVARPPLKLFLEPTENAYTMVLPATWTWTGQVFRSSGVPGYFTWKVQSPDGATGAFSAPPASFNIAVPYTPAGQAARTIVLPALQQQYPGIKLDKVEDLPRAGAYYRDGIKLLGLGNNPRVDKARADYLTTLNGVPVRIRVTIGTFMLDQSPLLGGRGDWFLTAGGAWAPVDGFDAGYALGRGAMASLHTAPAWKRAQFRVAGAAAGWAEGVREALGDWFDEDYIRGQ